MISPIEGKPFQIKETKIRGEVSKGMLCAEDEIGLGINHEGIMILTTDYVNGTPLNKLYKNEKDVIYEISVTPNRGDATSHLGTARDLKAYFNRQLNLPTLKDLISVIQKSNKSNCGRSKRYSRYSGVTLRGLKVSQYRLAQMEAQSD